VARHIPTGAADKAVVPDGHATRARLPLLGRYAQLWQGSSWELVFPSPSLPFAGLLTPVRTQLYSSVAELFKSAYD